MKITFEGTLPEILAAIKDFMGDDTCACHCKVHHNVGCKHFPAVCTCRDLMAEIKEKEKA